MVVLRGDGESLAATVNAREAFPEPTPPEGWKVTQGTGLVYPQEQPWAAPIITVDPPPVAAKLYGLAAVTGAEQD